VQDYLGRDIIAPQEFDGVFIATLEKSALLETRQKLGFLNDKDDFEIK
jgi:predicted amidohydrolase